MGHVELYKKYRPKVWEEMIGQDRIASSLRAAVKTGKTPTAYLFAGARGTGKTTAALILAKALNCLHPDNGNPCNKCEVCQSIDDNTQIGVTYFSAAQKSGVDDIKQIVEQARLQVPINRQVFIIDEVHNLRQGKGFEALLIPLEQKDMPALFILCTTEIEKVPDTIKSRCQQRKFNLVDADTLFEHVEKINRLEGLNLSDDVLHAVVRTGRGSVRDTLTALESASMVGETSKNFGGQLLVALSKRSVPDVLTVIAEANEDGVIFRDFAEQLFEDLRNLLLYDQGCDSSLVGIIPVDNPDRVVKGLCGYRGISYGLRVTGEAISKMASGQDERISFEFALVDIIGVLNRIARQAKK